MTANRLPRLTSSGFYDTLIAEKWNKSDSFASVESIECPDDNTVVMNLKYPDVSLIAKLSWYGTFGMPKHLYEGTETATNEYNMKPVGTGPFKFVEYQKGVQVVLERNEEYWGDKAKLERSSIRFFRMERRRRRLY